MLSLGYHMVAPFSLEGSLIVQVQIFRGLRTEDMNIKKAQSWPYASQSVSDKKSVSVPSAVWEYLLGCIWLQITKNYDVVWLKQ